MFIEIQQKLNLWSRIENEMFSIKIAVLSYCEYQRNWSVLNKVTSIRLIFIYVTEFLAIFVQYSRIDQVSPQWSAFLRAVMETFFKVFSRSHQLC